MNEFLSKLINILAIHNTNNKISLLNYK